jgi:hypothetical protein
MRLLDYDGEPVREGESHLVWAGNYYDLAFRGDGVLIPAGADPKTDPPVPVVVPASAARGELFVRAKYPSGLSNGWIALLVHAVDYGGPMSADGHRARLANLGFRAVQGAIPQALQDGSVPEVAMDMVARLAFALSNGLDVPFEIEWPIKLEKLLREAHDTANGSIRRL